MNKQQSKLCNAQLCFAQYTRIPTNIFYHKICWLFLWLFSFGFICLFWFTICLHLKKIFALAIGRTLSKSIGANWTIHRANVVFCTLWAKFYTTTKKMCKLFLLRKDWYHHLNGSNVEEKKHRETNTLNELHVSVRLS